MGRFIGIDLGGDALRAAILTQDGPWMIPLDEGQTAMPALVALDRDGSARGGLAARRLIAEGRGRRLNELSRPKDVRGRIPESEFFRPGITVSEGLLPGVINAARKRFGSDITGAMVAIPPSFSPDERQSIVDILKGSGLNTVRIISRTAADALMFNQRFTPTGKLLFCRLDREGFTASVIEVIDGVAEVISHAWTDQVSGAEIDRRLVKRLAEAFRWQNGIDLNQDEIAMQRLHLAVEEARRDLSDGDMAVVHLPYAAVTQSGPIHLGMTIRTADCDAMAADLLAPMATAIQQALDDASVKSGSIRCVLSGDPSNRSLAAKAIFQATAQNPILIPEESAVMGTALYGGSLDGTGGKVIAMEVMGYTVSIGLAGGTAETLIPRGVAYPVTMKRMLSTTVDGQTTVSSRLFMGESTQSAENTPIGRVTIRGIVPAPAGAATIELTISVDWEGLLKLSAIDKIADQPLTVETEGCLEACSPPVIRDLPESTPKDPDPTDPADIDLRERTLREVVGAILPSVDNLERALRVCMDTPGSDAIAKGLELTLRGLRDSLTRLGLEEIPALDLPFDPKVHHAVDTVSGGRSGYVISVVEKGYRLNGSVLRYAKVYVSE